jgi:hypothetical protein
MSSPTPDSVIPASAFPHILTAILDASTDPVLRSFRATSRAFRLAADARLFRDLAVHALLADLDS